VYFVLCVAKLTEFVNVGRLRPQSFFCEPCKKLLQTHGTQREAHRQRLSPAQLGSVLVTELTLHFR
jgi:hypothetical protein